MGLQHDTSTLESTVMGDHKLHLVLFINSKDETSTKATEKFEEEYALTAQEMLKYGVRVGVVDCGLHKKAASKFGVQQYPTLVSVEGPSTINPYTKKNMRNVKALRERTSKKIKKYILRGLKRLPNYVTSFTNLTDLTDSIASISKRGLKSAVLITSKKRISPVLKGLSSDLKDQIEINQIGVLDGNIEIELLNALKIVPPPNKNMLNVVKPVQPKKKKKKPIKEEEEDEIDLDVDEEEKEQDEENALEEQYVQDMKDYDLKVTEVTEQYNLLLSKATTLPTLIILNHENKIIDTFKGDSSSRLELYTFLELHSTSEPVLAKDAKPIDLGYEIVRDVKTHKSLIDDGF